MNNFHAAYKKVIPQHLFTPMATKQNGIHYKNF